MKHVSLIFIAAALLFAGCIQKSPSVITETYEDDDLSFWDDLFADDYWTPEDEIEIVANPGPGPYVGSTMGYFENRGTVTVTLEVTDGVLTSVKVEGPDETMGVGSNAIYTMGDIMLEKNSIKIDAVTGATYTSESVLIAAAKALGQAGLTDDDLKR